MLLLVAWTTSTIACNLIGGQIMEPARWGLDFAFVAVFAALSMSLWQGRNNLLPWVVAAGLAMAGEHWLPGKLYIALGGIGGAMTAVIQELMQTRWGPAEIGDGVKRVIVPGEGENHE